MNPLVLSHEEVDWELGKKSNYNVTVIPDEVVVLNGIARFVLMNWKCVDYKLKKRQYTNLTKYGLQNIETLANPWKSNFKSNPYTNPY